MRVTAGGGHPCVIPLQTPFGARPDLVACGLCPIAPRQLSVDHRQDKQAIRQVEGMLNQVFWC